jgi:hypothetical protein
MRYFLGTLALGGVILAAIGIAVTEAWMILVGVAMSIVALVMVAQGAVLTRGRFLKR